MSHHQLGQRAIRFDGLFTGKVWLEPAWVTVDLGGNVVAVGDQAPGDATLPVSSEAGFALPGFINSHSHAFQYAMAGHAEHVAAQAADDDFWTWRDAMYALAGSMTPERMQAIATTLYRQMLRRGITHVVEFHYLHHDQKGRAYQDPGEMSGRLVEAARTSGMRLTLVPVLYKQGGFGQPPKPSQARFISPSVDAYMRLLEAARRHVAQLDKARCGIGVHSLRAALADDIKAVAQTLRQDEVFHIHAAEQRREVDECLATLGKRPVRWLLDEVGLDRRFALVHCTHMDDAEITDLARSKACAVVCPSTEGNLGDGFFETQSYLAQDGCLAIGTDSHVGLSPAEELRWLDYAQRMRDRRRNVLCRPGEDSAELFWRASYKGGRAAAALPAGEPWRVGEPFDAVVLDRHHPVIAAAPAERRMAAYIHAAGSDAIRCVLRAGRAVSTERPATE